MKTTTNSESNSKPTQRQSMIGEPPPFPCPAKAGRPSGYSPEKVTAACHFVELTGVSDTAAAALAGVTKSSLTRWKQFDEEVQMLLTAARARYVLPRLRIIGETRLKDGQPDWRAQAWLIKFSDPETYGPPSKRRRLQDVEFERPTDEELLAIVELARHEQIKAGWEGWDRWHQERGGVVTPEMMLVMQICRQKELERMNAPKDEADAAEQAGAETPAETSSAESDAPRDEAGETHSSGSSEAAAEIAAIRLRRAEAARRAGVWPRESGTVGETPILQRESAKNVAIRPEMPAKGAGPGLAPRSSDGALPSSGAGADGAAPFSFGR